MNDSILIRQETEKDFEQVEEVVRLAFGNMPESDHTEHILVERLRQSDAYIPELSLVAETGDKKNRGTRFAVESNNRIRQRHAYSLVCRSSVCIA